MKTNWTPSAAYNIEEWMQDFEEDASEVGARNGDVSHPWTGWRNAHQHVNRGRRQCRRYAAP